MDSQLSLILIRGLPGAGKTTLAQVLSEEGRYPVFSVDDYFTSEDKHYEFRFDENHLAYKQCSDNTEAAMKKKTPKIFLDNTFTLEWEMEPYFRLAAQYAYRVFVLTLENRHHGKNTHGISDQQIQKMAEKYKIVLL